ncbi:pilus assembly protein PilM [Pseudenhygromyxa sp. WMMC2535]|uniref:pilus assembly protein PilM n=1 Tax=Pseudenhygromyxa sp. WMMC2535 TaxID=2712867 RepID=UPI00155623C9|nr:pilus assembly protein PilM [Pseudenhygromyxa sp. WMMC2535]NVB36719.1 pilus assembly protein PilM [Pseudenhygromyxa sp. WMMC2535]
MAQKFVGIDLGNRKVKIAVITSGLRGVQVLHVWEQAIQPAEKEGGHPLDPAIDATLQLIRERGLKHLPTGISLPGGEGSYRVLSFPFDDPRQIAQAIDFEIDGQFPLPIEQLAVDHLAVKRGDGRGRALVVAAKRANIDHIVARMQLAGVDLRVVTTGALAMAQAMAGTPTPPLPPSVEPELQPVSLIVDMGEKSTDLVTLGEKGPVAARSLRRGGRQLVRELAKLWRIDKAAAQAALEREGTLNDPAVRRAMQPLLREIEHTRTWLRAEVGCHVVEIRLSGGTLLRDLGTWLQAETGVEVGPVAPRESPQLRGVEGHDWSGSLIALGTAMATGRRPLIQLHDAFEGGGEGQWIQQHLSTLLALGVAILCFATVDTLVRVRAAERHRDAYLAELEGESLRAFGQQLSSSAEVQAKLASVEGGDINSKIPERGALEVLEALTKLAAPAGGREQAAPIELPPGYTSSVDETGQVVVLTPDGQPVPLAADGTPMLPAADDPTGAAASQPEAETPAEDPAAGPPVVTDPNAGILADDDLVFSYIEIRELKTEMKLSATRTSAQDRLARKLEQVNCIQEVKTGKVNERNDRRVFEMNFDHNCFYGNLATGMTSEEEEPEEEEPEELEDDEEEED